LAADIRAVVEGRPASVAAEADATVIASEPSKLAAAPALAEKSPVANIDQPSKAPVPSKPSAKPALVAIAAVVLLAIAGGAGYLVFAKRADVAPPMAATPSTAPAAVPATAAAPAAAEPGILTISATGFADPARFNGDAAAAGTEARADARRQLIEKALSLLVAKDSLDRNYQWVYDKFLPRSGEFIKATFSEDAPQVGKDGLMATATRAAIRVRDVQRSLNKMSGEERVQFIRNNGDPKISVQMLIANAETTQPMPAARSLLAENVIKERIKSFGFRTWSIEGETATGAEARAADFHIIGEVKVKALSAKLAASGLTVTKIVLTSWTVKAIDKASGEEIYNSSKLPQNASWASEDAALAEIGRLVGDEFSKNFFLEHFNFGSQKISLVVSGLPGAAYAAALLRELRSLREVLDAQPAGEGSFQLELADGNAGERVAEGVLQPLNAKLGQPCFALGAVAGKQVSVTFAATCGTDAVRGKLESTPPAGLLSAPPARGKALLKA
jgi:serine/threonine-protein kinase